MSDDSNEFMAGGIGPLTRDQFKRLLAGPEEVRPRIDWEQRDADVEMGGAHPDINFYFADPLSRDQLLDELEAVTLKQLADIATLRAQGHHQRQETTT